MRKLVVAGIIGAAVVLGGCGQFPSGSPGSPWVAKHRLPSGTLVRYYQVSHATVPPSNVGQSVGVLFMHGITNGLPSWQTNISTRKNIHLYAIVGIPIRRAVAVELGQGPYFKAASTGRTKP